MQRRLWNLHAAHACPVPLLRVILRREAWWREREREAEQWQSDVQVFGILVERLSKICRRKWWECLFETWGQVEVY